MALLQVTLSISPKNRAAAAAVYEKYKSPFLTSIPGAVAKTLLVRDEDVQVMHEFSTGEQARSYLKSRLFEVDVVGALKPLLDSAPDVRIYSTP
jgi:hypothetical protein